MYDRFNICKVIATTRCFPLEPIIINRINEKAITPITPFMENVLPRKSGIRPLPIRVCSTIQDIYPIDEINVLIQLCLLLKYIINLVVRND